MFSGLCHTFLPYNTIIHVESDGGGKGRLFKGSTYSIFGCIFGGGCLLIRAWVHTVFKEIQDAKSRTKLTAAKVDAPVAS